MRHVRLGTPRIALVSQSTPRMQCLLQLNTPRGRRYVRGRVVRGPRSCRTRRRETIEERSDEQAGELRVGFRATNEVAHGGRAVSGRWGVDAGAISTRNTSKGALVVEAHAVFRALASGMALDEV